MPSIDPNVGHFEGGNALSDFRARALMTRLQAVNSRVCTVTARHVHWAACAPGLDVGRLSALLDYGEPRLQQRMLVQVAKSRVSREALARNILIDTVLPLSVLRNTRHSGSVFEG